MINVPTPRAGDLGEEKKRIELEPFPESEPLAEPSVQPAPAEPVPA